MKTSTPPALRSISAVVSVVSALAALFFPGCSTVVKVDSMPAGAAVSIGGKSLGSTPTQWEVSDANKPVDVSVSLPGYFPENFRYTAGSHPAPITVSLEPAKLAKSFELSSEPAGATVTLDGRAVGTAPMTLPVQFVREGKRDPWTPQRLLFAKASYQPEAITLTADLDRVPTANLSLLKDERVYTVTATNLTGAVLNAEVTLNGKAAGKTPLSLPITYQRADKSTPWPKFTLSVELPGQYKPVVTELSYTRETAIPLKLEPLFEITAKIISPDVVMTPTGAALKFVERAAVATLNIKEDSTTITDLKAVTNYPRQDMRPNNRLETISSFTVTPDGQNVIFALTDLDEAGNRYSNLFIKRADDASGGVSRLTQGTRFFDTEPYIANDGSNYLVFTSNRGDRSKPDIFRVSLVENRLSGGISRLTNDNRFNYRPSYGDSNRQLFYLSVEPAFPLAEPQISSIRFDGSLPTQLPVVGEQINNSHPDKVYFVKVDSDTKKKQIYSITADGKLETALINQEDFKKANCFQPSASADGQRLLFVSDHTGDPKDRPNNDIYLINADGTGLQRLTYNESDDTMPIWSPTEEGVVYFLSTRGGATNIWRLKLVSGR